MAKGPACKAPAKGKSPAKGKGKAKGKGGKPTPKMGMSLNRMPMVGMPPYRG